LENPRLKPADMQSNKSLHSNRFRTAACEASSYETEVDLNREGSRLQLANQSIWYFQFKEVKLECEKRQLTRAVESVLYSVALPPPIHNSRLGGYQK
jgi:hypothetical protein